jgi:hypothetical protein
MGKDNVFDRLVKDLSSDERRKMIEKMEGNISVSQEPMVFAVENESLKSIEEEYASLSWLDKLIIFIKTVIFRKNKLEITKNVMVDRIARQVITVNPDLIDMKHRSVSGKMSEMVDDLRQSVDFIRSPLSICLGMDKTLFYSLMGQLEFPGLYEELRSKVDPWVLSKANPVMDVSSVRRKLSDDLDNMLLRISREDRRRMTEQTRTLNQLYQLSIHPFSQISSQFLESTEGKALSASFSSLASALTEFASVLKSFRNPPSVRLLETVFLLYYSQILTDEGALEEKVEEGIARCEALIQKIRNFCQAVPLADILKLIHEDPFYSVGTASGGEDWFYCFNQYWQDVLADKMRVFNREKTLEGHVSELLRYWELSVLNPVRGYPPQDRLTAFSNSLAALITFYDENFQSRLYFPMKIILVDGNFYKKNNREEYERVFQDIVKIPERIRWFEQRISPEGDAGKKVVEAVREFKADQDELDRRLVTIYNAINRDALTILEDSMRSLWAMGKLMNGIVLGNGGTYDTLSNLSELGGRNSDEFRQTVISAADDVHKIGSSLSDIVNLEKETMEELQKEARQQAQ